MRLFWKIYAAVFAIFAVVMLLISYVIGAWLISRAENQLLERVTILSDSASREIQYDFLESQWPLKSLKKLSERPGFLFWWVVRDDGVIHLADKASFMGTYACDYFPQVKGEKINAEVFLNKLENYGIFVNSLELGEQKWSFWLGFSLKEIGEMRRNIISLELLLFMAALSILGVLLYVSINHFTRPIKDLTAGTAIIGNGDLTHMVIKRSQDELGQLADAFNKMVRDLRKMILSRDQEIAERQRAEAALQQSEANLQTLFDSVEDFVWVLDLEGHILQVNQTVPNRLGYSEEELRGKPALMVHPVDRHADAMAIMADLVSGKTDSCPLPLLAKDGTQIPVETKVARGRWADRDVFFAVSRDITERQRAYEELQTAYQKLKETTVQLFQTSKLATLGEMSTGLAHEINQPLTAISLTEVTVRKLLERGLLTEEKTQESMLDIEQSVQRMSKIITHIRTFARQKALEFQEIDVNESVENSFKLFGEQLRLHEIQVTKELAFDLPEIIGEPYQIEQVVINLLTNARDALDDKGNWDPEKLKGWSKQLKIKTALKGDWVCIEVSDNGVGMSAETREKMFDPFYTTKEVGRATGLGLSISYGIIQSHQGKIEVESELGKGTTFLVKLPLKMGKRNEGQDISH